jgi:hypothetical protein
VLVGLADIWFDQRLAAARLAEAWRTRRDRRNDDEDENERARAAPAAARKNTKGV